MTRSHGRRLGVTPASGAAFLLAAGSAAGGLPDPIFRDGFELIQRIQASTPSLTVGEASSTSFGVRLALAPATNVTVGVASDESGAAVASPSSLTFTPGNYFVAQTVMVTGVSDSDCGNEALGVLLFATGIPDEAVDVIVTDNDPQSIDVSTTMLPVDEGSQATFTVRLGCDPRVTLDVALSSSDPLAAQVAPVSLSFGPGDFATPQVATVTGIDDADADDESVDVTASATGAPSRTIAVTVTDDDGGSANRRQASSSRR